MTYLNRFTNNSDIIDEYKAPQDALEGANILIAWYGEGNYCGDSFVLYERAGKLYEVNGDHCSCNGLEGQWEALNQRGFYGSSDGIDEMTDKLKELIKSNLGSNDENR